MKELIKKSIKQSEKMAQSLNTCHMACGPESHPRNPHEKLASEACACELSDGEMVDVWILLASIVKGLASKNQYGQHPKG